MAVKLDGLVLYDVRDLCAMFKVTPRTVREALSRGRLRGRKFARRWYVDSAALMEFFRQSAK